MLEAAHRSRPEGAHDEEKSTGRVIARLITSPGGLVPRKSILSRSPGGAMGNTLGRGAYPPARCQPRRLSCAVSIQAPGP